MKRLWIAGFLALASAAGAEITYRVEVLPDTSTLHVVMHLPRTEHGCHLQIPNWGPGGYVIRDGSKAIHNLSATDEKGQPLALTPNVEGVVKKYQDGAEWKQTVNPVTTWSVVPAKETNVEYDVTVAPVDGAMSWSGPSTYLYEVDRRKETCKLGVVVPQGWQAYAGLDEIPVGNIKSFWPGRIFVGPAPDRFERTVNFAYTAKDYDTFADNPFTVGGADGLIVDTYFTLGKPHYIVMRGKAKSKVDRAKLIKACKFVSDVENDFFGNRPPYNKYVWHFAVNDAADGAGGLEHLSSTQITLAQGVGPRAVSVLAHEFFHLWNVKRIRSLPLGPFDYTRLPETGAIWWLEGVTDYYAFTLLHRYGWTDDESYFKTAASNFQIVQRNPAHAEVSPNEASMRVGEPNNGHGNSNGYRISYYNLGWLAGMCLDIDLRVKTGNKHTLDDIEHALWDLCKNGKPGFAEDEIRKQYVRFGGDGATFDRIVMQPNMPVEEILAKAGLRAVSAQESYVDLGFGWGGPPGGTGLPVNNVHGPAEGKLQTGDGIVAVNGTALTGDTGRALAASMAAATANLKGGTAFKVTVKRGDQTVDVEITPVTANRSIYTVERQPAATAEQKKLADAWLSQRALRAN